MRRIALVIVLFGGPADQYAQAKPPLPEISALVDSVRSASFPQLRDARIAIRPMRGKSVYLKSRFTFSSYFFARRLGYVISFNPSATARNVPPDGLEAIIAHELAHAADYRRRGRLGLLGLVRLVSNSYEIRFERAADLEAIARGYGPGLQSYRTWLYTNIPANRVEKKKRTYYTPEEIGAIVQASGQDPRLMSRFLACVPRNLAEIELLVKDPAATCPHR